MADTRDPRYSLIVRADDPCRTAADARRDLAKVTAAGRREWDRAQRVTVQFYGQAPVGSSVGPAYLDEVQATVFGHMGIPELYLCNVPEADLAVVCDPRIVYGLMGPSGDGRVDSLAEGVSKDEYVVALRRILDRLARG